MAHHSGGPNEETAKIGGRLKPALDSYNDPTQGLRPGLTAVSPLQGSRIQGRTVYSLESYFDARGLPAREPMPLGWAPMWVLFVYRHCGSRRFHNSLAARLLLVKDRHITPRLQFERLSGGIGCQG